MEGRDKVAMGLRFAKIERKLNEVDRARAIYIHLSQYCEPNAYQ
jgi:pre-mRNA-splicing factor SYF1